MSFLNYLQSFYSACTTVIKCISELLSGDVESDIRTTYSNEFQALSIPSTRTYRSVISNRGARSPTYRTATTRHSPSLRSNQINDKEYFVPDDINKYFLHNARNGNRDGLEGSLFKIGNTLMRIKQGRLDLTEENYRKYIHILLWLEELEDKLNFNNFKFYDVKINMPYGSNVYYTLDLPGAEDKKSPFFIGSSFTVKARDTAFTGCNKSVLTRIKAIDNTTLYFELKGFSRYDLLERRFDIEFKFSRFLYIKMHMAVDNVATYLKSFIFPQEEAGLAMLMTAEPILRYFNPNIKTNYEQMKAVTCIVQGRSDKAPFILHGPPGTGKTVTIVEAILQLVNKNSLNRVLVCAHSNTAVDNVAVILLKYVKEFDKNLFLRVYSRSRECIPDLLKDFSTFSPVEQAELMSYRIILCTLSQTSSYELNFITHIVIDEAGQASEPSCLLPLCKVKTPRQLILSGDDKQLGPVVLSNAAKKLGFEISLMERLRRDCNFYSNDNGRYMVMLKKNYRSDNDIIVLSNLMFYEGKLMAMAKSDILTRKNVLNNKSTCRGIVFHAVFSTECKEADNPSYYNITEFEIVKKYIYNLRQMHFVKDEDIGIITPYAAQVTLIKGWVKKQKLKIDVNTVDAFQGQERRVIVISTVRGQGKRTDKVNLGFLTDVKRSNVALTRAKAKAIVIGNPLCLRDDDFWYEYICRCKCIGTYYDVDINCCKSSATRQDLNVMMKNLRL